MEKHSTRVNMEIIIHAAEISEDHASLWLFYYFAFIYLKIILYNHYVPSMTQGVWCWCIEPVETKFWLMNLQ